MASFNTTASHSVDYLSANSSINLYAATASIMVICTVLLALRLYARSLTLGGRGWDEVFLISSWIFLMGVCILMFVAIPRAGIGRHLPAVLAENPHKIVTWNFIIYLLDWFYVPSNMLSRISVVSLYLRIFPSGRTRYFCWAIIVFLVCNCIAFLITANLECFPLQRVWDKSIKGRCFDVELWWKLSNPPNIVADVAILLLPIEKIWHLNAPAARKFGIWFVCLTGSIGLFASCMRTASFFVTLERQPPDPTWTSCSLLVWTVIESGMYNAAACLICLRPLYGKIPQNIRNRWGLQSESRKPRTRVHEYGITTIGSRRTNKWWIKMDRDDAQLTSRSLQTGHDEEIELAKPQTAKKFEGKPKLESIKVNRTFDVTSTLALIEPKSYEVGFIGPDSGSAIEHSVVSK